LPAGPLLNVGAKQTSPVQNALRAPLNRDPVEHGGRGEGLAYSARNAPDGSSRAARQAGTAAAASPAANSTQATPRRLVGSPGEPRAADDRRTGRPVASGIVAGAGIAFVATRALGALLFEVDTNDLGTYLAVAGLMVLVGLAASYVPARRASSVDPMVSLRSE